MIIFMSKLTLTISEFADQMNISRTKAYELAKNGSIPVIRIGRSIRVITSLFEDYLKDQVVNKDSSTLR
ncbi:helix-turn-helix domain-containing protein [Petroclostridium sp. X23]|uniref:helix-turn-helix domain-containing protein n=1 Tax=Petroclostridium sp. X23 TaxID=3045146 RepID=UPI0024AE7DF9|nr:helix-turn-helix domain-containing protein [Petroclostridium sp. X23]WHH57198.1 helix-turn-helix domain-containing protein [Petroclostridium sp. X23]